MKWEISIYGHAPFFSMCAQAAVAVLAALLVWVSDASVHAAETNSDSSADDVLRSYVAKGRVPGLVAIAATKDRILHQGAFGSLDTENQKPLPIDAIFHIASMTKPVTSVALMQLVEQGLIELEAGVDRYLPEQAHLKVLEGFDDAGQPRLRDAQRPPTIRELLSNTSGYAYTVWNGDLRRYAAYVAKEKKRRQVGDDELPFPLVTDPGTRWEYSGGTQILGQVVEKVSGLTLEEYFRKHIFEPLRMPDTFFQVPADKWGRAGHRYKRAQDGSPVAATKNWPATAPKVTQFAGDGGLRSTGPDYLRFIRAFLNDGELDGARILKAETVDLMSRNHIGDFRAGEMISAIPAASNDVHLFPGATNKFGLGFLINALPVSGGRAAGSLMWAGAFNTYFWIDRQQGIGGVVMTQLTPFADHASLEMVENYEKAVYALPR